eukprot:m.20034 g.20034  ORF g.20034 m.20034 type:complete len:120 (-) comp8536_c0_seq3:587-946(-)
MTDSDSIELKIVHGGEKFKLHIGCDKTVDDLKGLIEVQVGVDKEKQKLIYKGVQLKDGKATLKESKMKRKAKLTLIGSKDNPDEMLCKKAFLDIKQSYDQQGELLNSCEKEWDNIEKVI